MPKTLPTRGELKARHGATVSARSRAVLIAEEVDALGATLARLAADVRELARVVATLAEVVGKTLEEMHSIPIPTAVRYPGGGRNVILYDDGTEETI